MAEDTKRCRLKNFNICKISVNNYFTGIPNEEAKEGIFIICKEGDVYRWCEWRTKSPLKCTSLQVQKFRSPYSL